MILKRLLCIVLLTATACGPVWARKPRWAKKRPVSETHYIGIGVVHKRDEVAHISETAKKRALADLASEILVTIKSEFVDRAVERSGLSETDVRSEIKASAKAVLTGYDCSQKWENKKEYHVLCQLSKADYAEQERTRIETAKRLSLDLYDKARTFRNTGSHAQALTYLVQALIPIQEYPGRPLETSYRGKKILLANAVYTALQDTLSKITLRAEFKEYAAIEGRSPKVPIVVIASAEREKLKGIPLRCRFLKGEGEIVGHMRTGRIGRAVCKVLKIHSPEKTQILEVRLDLRDLAPKGRVSAVLQETLRRLTSPRIEIPISVHGMLLHLNAVEMNLEEAVTSPYIETVVRKALISEGYVLTEDPAKAELHVTIEAQSRKGAITHGIAATYVDATLAIVDPITNEEIYQGTLKDIKGMQLDFKQAGLKAYGSAVERIEGIVLPSMITRLKEWTGR